MSRTLLGGGRESAAEWAAVASHENAHARGFLEERDAHMSGLATYLGVTGNLGIKTDDNLVTEMLFGALLNDNSANEDGVYHWALAMKEDGSGTYGWREDGSLDFNISLDELQNNSTFMERMGPKGDELKKLIQNGSSHPNDNSDGLTLTIGYETMNEGLAQTLGAYLGMGKSDGEITMHAQGSNPPPKALDEFVKGTITLKDVSEKITLAMASINNLENGVAGYTDLSVKNSLNTLFASLVNADETGILVRNPVEDNMITDPDRLLQQETERGIETFPMALNEGETNFRVTSGYGRQALIYEDGSVRWRSHLAGDFANETPGETNPLIASSDGDTYNLSWHNDFGLNYLYGTDSEQLSHMGSNSLMNLLSMWGTQGVSVDSGGNIYGIMQNSIIGETGSTGLSTGIHLDYRINYNGNDNPFDYWHTLSDYFVNVDTWGGFPDFSQYSVDYINMILEPQFDDFDRNEQKLLIDDMFKHFSN